MIKIVCISNPDKTLCYSILFEKTKTIRWYFLHFKTVKTGRVLSWCSPKVVQTGVPTYVFTWFPDLAHLTPLHVLVFFSFPFTSFPLPSCSHNCEDP